MTPRISPSCSPFLAADDSDASERGTTLLELLVAIALLALLCSYALGALSHLQSFNRVVRDIEAVQSVEAVTSHVRRVIEGSRPIFFTTKDTEARLAFIGEENRISLVTDADSRLELGGLYLVQIGLIEDEGGTHRLVAFRRVFRSEMEIEPGTAEPIQLAEPIGLLRFGYFGSPEEGMEAKWHPKWLSINSLPKAVSVEVATKDGKHRWPPMVITIPAAQ